MTLHDWTQQLDFSLYVKYQSYGYTRPITEGIRRASPGGNAEHSDVANVTSAAYN